MLRKALQNRDLTSGLGIVVVRFGGAMLAVLVTWILSRALGSAGFGLYALMITYAQLALIPFSQGGSRLLLRVGSHGLAALDYGQTRGLWRRANQAAVLLALPLAAIAILLFAVSPATDGYDISILTAIMIICLLLFDGISAPRFALIRAFDKPIAGQLPEVIVRPLTQIAVVGLFVLSGYTFGVDEAFVSIAAAAGLSMVIGYFVLSHTKPADLANHEPTFDSWNWLKSALVMGGNSAVLMLNASISLIVLGFLADASSIGQFRVAIQVSQFAGLTYVALTMIASQRFAYLGKKGDREGMARIATLYSRLATLASLFALAVLLSFGEPLFELVFGPEFIAAATLACILTAGEAVNAGVGMSGAMLVMNNRENTVLKCTSASLLVNVALCLTLVPPFGVTGAAIAAISAMIVRNLGTWYFARRLTGIDTSVVGLQNAVK